MVSCTTKQHWELLLDADVVIGEARDEGRLVEGDVGDGEVLVIRDDVTDTGDDTTMAEGGKLADFEGENVSFVVVFVVFVRGAGDVTRVFEREYGDSIVTTETPEV